MKLLAAGNAKRVLITGVNRTTTVDELKELASQGGQYFTCCVDIDKEARNTIDNATETSEWVALHHYGSIIVVTSNYHMPRALAELARVMPGVTLIPYPVVDNNVHLDRWWTYPGTTKLLLSEYLKYLPALGRLGATDLVRMVLTGGNIVSADVARTVGRMARSLLFNVLFYVTTAMFVVIGSPLLFAPRRWAMAALAHSRPVRVVAAQAIVGTKLEVRGNEKLPAGACLVAPKHQSAWETFALIPLFRDPALLMKRELFWIPFHGWFSYKFDMIPVDRDKGPSALRRMLREAKKRAAAGREIIIFPEGTRRAPGAPPDYKTGVVLLYEALGVPCVPVALNSGVFWPRRSLTRKPGTIVVEFLDPIPPVFRHRRWC